MEKIKRVTVVNGKADFTLETQTYTSLINN